MLPWQRVYLVVLLSAVLASAAAAPAPPHAQVDHGLSDAQIDAEIARMSDEEKLAQLMVTGFAGTSITPEVEDLVGRWRVGALALFSRNVKSPDQVRKLTKSIRALVPKGAPPPFLAIDQEGGSVVRLKQGATVLPSAMALGASRSRTLAYLVGRALGSDLRALGLSMNFAPVLDVNSNPQNPVIGIRSIGEKPELVAELGRWFIRGQDEAGILSVAKHFPGHGDTQLDSHYAMPSLPHDLERLRKVELFPFKYAFSHGLAAVMTAHIALSKVSESPDMPATLSKRVLTEILRKELGFTGLVITDGLEMRGIVEGEGIGRAAVKALNAGADMVMVLWSQRDREDVFTALRVAYLDGSLDKGHVQASLRRILRTKHQGGLYEPEQVAETAVYGAQRVLHDQVAEEIAERAITLVRDKSRLVPVIQDTRPRSKILFIGPEGALAAAMNDGPGEIMSALPTKEQRQRHALDAIAHSAGAQVIVAAAQNRYHLEVLRQVRDALPSIPMVLVSLGSPYYLSVMPNVDAYLCAYGDLPSSQRAVAKVIRGERGTVGRLPVTIPGLAAYGDGIVVGADSASTGLLPATTSALLTGSGGGTGFGESKNTPRMAK
jgi:beta-N-acetylhexosaminidase